MIERLQDAEVPLHVIATDVLSGRELRLSRGDALDAIMASAALPGVFPPVQWGDRDLIDGGIANNAPITHALELGADEVYVLPTGYACALEEPPHGALAMLLHSMTLLLQRRLIMEIELLKDRTRLIVLPPPCPLSVQPIEFSRARELIDRALEDSRRFLDSVTGEKSAAPLTMHAERLRPHAHAEPSACCSAGPRGGGCVASELGWPLSTIRGLGMRGRTGWLVGGAFFAGALAGAPGAAAQIADYRVTITNLTGGQPMSPPVVATHRTAGAVWHLNRNARLGVKEIAENGNNGPLLDDLRQRRISGRIFDYQQLTSSPMLPGPLVPAGRPGAATFPRAVTGHIRADLRRARRLSFVSMLVCTNDGFTGTDGIVLPRRRGQSRTVRTIAYETRTEQNTEVFADIMPPCQGLIGETSPSGAPGTAQSNPAIAETGVIIPHPGIAGNAELSQSVHAWGNPVAKIVIKRVR